MDTEGRGVERGRDERAVRGNEGQQLLIQELEDTAGLRIDDRIERRHCEVQTGTPVDPVPADDSVFRYPVDAAVRITTDHLAFEGVSRTFVHDGDSVTEVGHFESTNFEDGRYVLELSGPVKLYVVVDGPLRIDAAVMELEVHTERASSVRIGARSYHERPATTVTTTSEPTDVMAAVSTFGSAMKTTGSERSYPTLRGHPPTLAVGDELDVPPGLKPPESGVRIEVPPSLSAVMVVSPLAYYLGCRVVPGGDPRLVVEGESFSLDAADGFETTVERTLKRCFVLDAVVKTAGQRSSPLYGRKALTSELDVEPEDLYGRPGPERLRTYVGVPHEAVTEYVPTWKLTAHVQPNESSLEVLPFLVDDLAVVRTAPSSSTPDGAVSVDGNGRPVTGDAVGSTSESETPTGDAATEHFVEVAPSDSLEQAWVGEGTPMGASKAIPEAYQNRLDRTARDGEIEIVVVCNDEEMLAERDGVESAYGTREEFPVDVTYYEELPTDRLALVLESDVDYFHYIGHVDDEGFECTDGKLDADALDSVGVDIFFLNACRSYRQGRRLIEKGAIAGVVTLDDVINHGAVRIGRTLAELLNYGFPLRSALNVARDRSIVGSQYLVIGDGNADIAQAQSGSALLADVTPRGAEFELELTTYPATGSGMGSQFRPAIESVDDEYLCPGTLPTFRLSPEELETYFSTSSFPVRWDGDFTWTDRVTPTE